MRTKRQPARQSIWENRFGYLPAALSVGIGLLLTGLAALSGLLLLSDLSEWISALLLGLLLFCSGYSMGRFAGFHRRRKGWLTGLCCGLLLCGILLAVGLFWQGTAGSPVRLQYLGRHLRRECSPQEATEITATASTGSDSPANCRGRCKLFSVFA